MYFWQQPENESMQNYSDFIVFENISIQNMTKFVFAKISILKVSPKIFILEIRFTWKLISL